ncbi:MAG: AAA family ATPase, partial [Desulfobacterales bacterium]|nr:AAA family ATPase [Desulfobacterales bacterium]
MELEGYSELRRIHSSYKSVVYTGLDKKRRQAVWLKRPVKAFPSARQISGLSREFEILGHLDIPGIPKAWDFLETRTSAVLITQHLEGTPLRQAMKQNRIDLDTALLIGLGISRIVGDIHRQSFCHRDLSPDNILWDNRGKKVGVVDFGSALEFPHKARAVINPTFVEGSRAYMSPEQSGRMNRGLDYRTDFYSLGVVLYELITGRLPFITQDPNELIYSHIALRPEPPEALKADIPGAVSNIVLKLLSKDPAERYQSADGLYADLERCLEQYRGTGNITAFALGEKDLNDRFIIPEKLYGRKKEARILLDVFDNVCKGSGRLVFVSGKSGVGKTSLVRELYNPLAARQGYIASGKFDQFLRHQPYSAMVQALSGFVKQVIGEGAKKVAAWKNEILDAVGQNGRVLTDVIPELEMLIGPQPAVEALPADEERGRFNAVFINLVSCFNGRRHPLVLFLDDLQWIDQASLSLLEVIVPVLEEHAVFIIGAYRSDEVFGSHPLMVAMNGFEAAGRQVSSICLEELDVSVQEDLLKDTLNLNRKDILALNRILHEKTHGNPLFLKTVLRALYRDSHLWFDYGKGSWRWRTEAIEVLPCAENVVQILKAGITSLSEKTVALLKLGSCIGSVFELDLLGRLAEMSRHSTAVDLQPAVAFGVIQPLDDDFELRMVSQAGEMPGGAFAFAHDQIQQAVYDMVPDPEKAALHWRIGWLVMDTPGVSESGGRLFDAVEHLNQGRDMAGARERIQLARLNLEAGKKAKKSAAFAEAETCLSHGAALLDSDCWEKHHDLAMEIHLELAEACYLVSAFDRADVLYRTIRSNTRTRKEELILCNIQAKQYHHQGLYQKAVDLEYQALGLLGYKFPGDDAGLLAIFEREKQKIERILETRDFDDLYDQQDVDDPDFILALELFFDMFTDGYLLGRGPLLAAVAATSARLSMERGNCPITSVGYIGYATVLCSGGNYRQGHAIGRLAVRLADKYQVAALKNYTYHVFALGINHWLAPLYSSYDYWHAASKLSLESGSPYAGWVFLQLAHVLLASGAPLERVEQQANDSLAYLAAARMDQIAQLLKLIVIQPLRHLKGETWSFDSLDDDNFSTEEILNDYKEAPFFFGHTVYSVIRASLLARDFKPLPLLTHWLAVIEDTVQAQIIQIDACFWATLHLAMGYDRVGEAEQPEYLAAVERHLERFRTWADLCPENFNHKYLLIQAEFARISQDPLTAMDFYDQARDQALASNFYLDAALSDELAGHFWESRGKQHLAKSCIERAISVYGRWGATGKITRLSSEFREFMEDDHSKLITPSSISASVCTESFSEVLDLRSMIKASQAISQFMQKEQLAGELLRLAVENAGATRGILLLEQDGGFVIADRADQHMPGGKGLETGVPFQESNELSPAVVNYVIHSGEGVVFNTKNRDEQFSRCSYLRLREPKSVCCVPIVRQNKIIGLLYLENSQLADAFKRDRLELLRIIASQSAISLENARIYRELAQMNQNLEALVRDRTRELHETNEELNAKNRELARLSTTDQLTGLFNR